jgi:hypothetical protein
MSSVRAALLLITSGLLLVTYRVVSAMLTAVGMEALASRTDWAVRTAVALTRQDMKPRIEQQCREAIDALIEDGASSARVLYEMSTMMWAGVRTRGPFRCAAKPVVQLGVDLRLRRRTLGTYTLLAWPLGSMLLLAAAVVAVAATPASPRIFGLVGFLVLLGLPATIAMESTFRDDPRRYSLLFGPGSGWAVLFIVADAGITAEWWQASLCFAGSVCARMAIRHVIKGVLSGPLPSDAPVTTSCAA